MGKRKNPVELAVERVGGVIKASTLLEVANNTVRDAMARGFMPNATKAQRERVLLLSKRSGVPALALLLGQHQAKAAA